MNEVNTSKMAEDFKILIEDLAAFIKATAGDASGRVADLRQRLVRKIEEGRAALAERKNTRFQRSVETEPGAETTTCDKRMFAVAMAIGVGVLLGLVLRRK